MAKTKELSKDTTKKIVDLHQAGKNLILWGQSVHENGEEKSQNYTEEPDEPYLQRAGTKVTKANISNTLRREGLKSCGARRIPLLKPVHVQARLKFAREHMDDPEEDWENIMCIGDPLSPTYHQSITSNEKLPRHYCSKRLEGVLLRI
ncbi:hypothetical protein F2P79_009156 [Pimephales promelas]|nr:hypothetical protein F2P79_009156 [Pimephales promelas]